MRLQTCCGAGLISQLEFDEGIGVFPQYRSIIRNRQSLINVSNMEDGNVVLAYTGDRKIVGYIALTYPDPQERWSKYGDNVIYELGSIEVSKDWRGLGIAQGMVRLTFADDWYEDKIAILTGYSWHWDLAGTSQTKNQYRKMLMQIFAKVKFQQFYTDEPNIAMDFANLLMARIGSRVSAEAVSRFYDLLFENRESYDF